jgi:hypothetical protein
MLVKKRVCPRNVFLVPSRVACLVAPEQEYRGPSRVERIENPVRASAMLYPQFAHLPVAGGLNARGVRERQRWPVFYWRSRSWRRRSTTRPTLTCSSSDKLEYHSTKWSTASTSQAKLDHGTREIMRQGLYFNLAQRVIALRPRILSGDDLPFVFRICGRGCRGERSARVFRSNWWG